MHFHTMFFPWRLMQMDLGFERFKNQEILAKHLDEVKQYLNDLSIVQLSLRRQIEEKTAMLDDVTRHRERVLNLICANLVWMHRFSIYICK